MNLFLSFSTAFPVLVSFDLHIQLCFVDEKKMGHSRGKWFAQGHSSSHWCGNTDLEIPGTISGIITPGHCSQPGLPFHCLFRRGARCWSAWERAKDEPAAMGKSRNQGPGFWRQPRYMDLSSWQLLAESCLSIWTIRYDRVFSKDLSGMYSFNRYLLMPGKT